MQHRLPQRFACIAGSVFAALWISGCGDNAPSRTETTQDSADVAAVAERQHAGIAIYDVHCSACHGKNGEGIKQLQPAIHNSLYMRSDPSELTKVILQGTAYFDDEAYKRKWSGIMIPHKHLSDDEIAKLVNFMQERFGGVSQGMTAQRVGAIRAELDADAVAP